MNIEQDSLAINNKEDFKLFSFTLEKDKPAITIESNWYVIGLLTLCIVVWLMFGKRLKQRLGGKFFVSKVKIKVKVGNVEFEEEISRSFQNIRVANRIYIELVTRKAAIPFDEDNDVVKEVYESWYTLFGIIRNEIKDVPGEFLINHEGTDKLIELTTDILNKGLRPHLTKYQARFSKWYQEQLMDQANQGKNPQDIQKMYPDFQHLIEDLKDINQILVTYSGELKKLVKGG